MNKKKVVYVCGWYNPLYNDLFNNLDKDIEVTMILSEKFPNYKLNNYEVKVFSGPDIGDYIYFYLKEREGYLLSY